LWYLGAIYEYERRVKMLNTMNQVCANVHTGRESPAQFRCQVSELIRQMDYSKFAPPT